MLVPDTGKRQDCWRYFLIVATHRSPSVAVSAEREVARRLEALLRAFLETMTQPEASGVGSEFGTIMVMKKVSIQDLKAHLSEAVAEAQAGRRIVITRHNQPVAQLGPARMEHVHHGARVGMGRVAPALKRGTKGRSLAILLEDRGTR
jgi:prevent-host-death family protein